MSSFKVAILGNWDDPTEKYEDVWFKHPVSVHDTNDLLKQDEKLKTYEGILCWHDVKLTQDIISKMSNCKGIVRVGAGFDNVDLKFAGEKGIVVSNTPTRGY